MQNSSKVLITGATGLSGSSIHKKLQEKGFENVLTPTHEELDLTRKFCVNDYFKEHKPEYVFHCAGKISTHMSHHKITNSEILSTDGYINLNTINAAANNHVQKLITVGSCWNYPKLNKGISEKDFDSTSSQGDSGHEISKFLLISLLKQLRKEKRLDSTILMIPPLYGDNVHEDVNDKHVFAYLCNNIYVAAKQKLREITLSSVPTNQRQFVHTDDFGEAAIMAMGVDSLLLNVANDEVFSMEAVAEKLAKKWGFEGKIKWEKQVSNEGPQILDCSLLKSKGWSPKIGLEATISSRLV